MVGDPAVLYPHDVDRLEMDFSVSWSDAKKVPFVRAVVRLVRCHSVTVGKLPVDLRMKVGECGTNVRVESSYACLVWSRVRLRRVISEVVGEEFVEDIKSSFALNFLGVASRNCLRLIRDSSRLILRSSPTRTPPVSSAAFQVSPKSLRLILAAAEAPILALPYGSFSSGDGPSTSKMTSFVTPCIVKSPLTRSSPSPFGVTALLLKVIVGYFST